MVTSLLMFSHESRLLLYFNSWSTIWVRCNSLENSDRPFVSFALTEFPFTVFTLLYLHCRDAVNLLTSSLWMLWTRLSIINLSTSYRSSTLSCICDSSMTSGCGVQASTCKSFERNKVTLSRRSSVHVNVSTAAAGYFKVATNCNMKWLYLSVESVLFTVIL